MKYFMGIDSGGTKCEAILANENAEILGHSICYGSDLLNGESFDSRGKTGLGRSKECILKAIIDCISDNKCEELYITVNQSLLNVDEILRKTGLKYKVLFFADEAEGIIKAINIEKCYIALVGTGAFCYYCNGNNHLYFEGLGPNLGDYGSGFYIGHQAVKAAAMSEWGEEYKTSLAPIINKVSIGKEYNCYGRSLVNFYFEMPDRSFVASFAKNVNEEAEKGDRISVAILKDAGSKLARTLCALVKNVRPCKENLPIVCAGSVMINSKIYRDAFTEYCKKYIPNNEIIFSYLPSVYGDLMNSVIKSCVMDKDKFYKNLLKNINQ